MKEYLKTLRYIMDYGKKRNDRTGVGTLSVFGTQNRYNLRENFPAVTTRKLFFKGVVHELLWMLKGDTNIKYLVDNNVHIWDEWADNDGCLGPIYGAQWRKWPSVGKEIDQIKQVIHNIKYNPESRRHIVSAWNVALIDEMRLPPCHLMYQFYVADGELSCHMYQRSCDYILGGIFNIASYALLTSMIAQVCDLKVGDFIHTIGDAHVYLSHINQANLQLTREPYKLPSLWLNPEIKDIDNFEYEDISLINYRCHPAIKSPIAV